MKKSLTFITVLIFCTFTYSQEAKTIKKLSFSQFEPYLLKNNDSIYVINFWATWCIPCREEMPILQKVHEQFKVQKVKVLLVSLDIPTQLESRLIPYIRTNKLTPEVILLDDPRQNEWIDKVDPKWSGAIPFTLIYGKGFRESYEKPFKGNELYTIIQNKLNKP